MLKYDFEKAQEDTGLIELRNKLRNFLIQSSLYEHKSVSEFLYPISSFLNKEFAIFKMRQGKYKECFEICVNQIKDFTFSLTIAEQGLKWHDQDRLIYYNLFSRQIALSETQEGEEKSETMRKAIEVLSGNNKHLPFSKLTKHFDDDLNFEDDTNQMFTKVLQSMEHTLHHTLLVKNISELEKHN